MASGRDRFFLVRLTRDESKVRTAFVLVSLLLLIVLGNTVYLIILSIRSSKPSVVASVSPTVTPLPTPEPVIPTVAITQAPVILAPSVQEYFITFGSGTNQTSDWTDVPGLTAQIDFGKYSRIKEIHFEASVVIPTANETASVRLFNETDQHPVWYSEIALTNGQFVSSNPIIYDTGSKLYQVQMKTSLQFTANLIQSRLHLILQ